MNETYRSINRIKKPQSTLIHPEHATHNATGMPGPPAADGSPPRRSSAFLSSSLLLLGLLLLLADAGTTAATATAAFVVGTGSAPRRPPIVIARALPSNNHQTPHTDDDRTVVVPYEAMVEGPHVDRLRREARRRARQLALRRRLGRLYGPLLGWWLDKRWERQWQAYTGGEEEGESWNAAVGAVAAAALSVGGDGSREPPPQQQQKPWPSPAATTWVVEGPVLPTASRAPTDDDNDNNDDDGSLVLLREPATGGSGRLRRWLGRGWQGLRRRLRRGAGAETEAETVEWGLYASSDRKKEQQLGRIGLRLRPPRGRALTDLERAAAEVFGPEAGRKPAALLVVVYCFVPLEQRGKGYGERMVALAAEQLLPAERGGGLVMLTADDNGSGRLVGFYERLGFRVAPALSYPGCDVLLRWIPPAEEDGTGG